MKLSRFYGTPKQSYVYANIFQTSKTFLWPGISGKGAYPALSPALVWLSRRSRENCHVNVTRSSHATNDNSISFSAKPDALFISVWNRDLLLSFRWSQKVELLLQVPSIRWHRTFPLPLYFLLHTSNPLWIAKGTHSMQVCQQSLYWSV